MTGEPSIGMRSRMFVLLASAASVAVPAMGHAQTSTAPSLSPPPAEVSQVAEPPLAAGGLEDIIVTARKRNESLQNIPVAVTAYTPAQIQRYDISTIDRVAAATPNLTVGRAATGAGAQITLRGIGTPASALGIESSTAVIVDGAYYGNGRILNEGFFDLARIEVLKGPQALFFGKNATAGVISINSANPGDSFEGSTRVGYEIRAKQVYAEQIISTPLTERLGVRVALRASKMFGGYATNLATPVTFTVTDVAGGPPQTFTTPAPDHRRYPRQRDLIGRITLRWEPIDGLTNTLKVSGDSTHSDDLASNNLISSCFTGNSTLQPTVACKRRWSYYHDQIAPEISRDFPFGTDDGQLYGKYKSYTATNNLEWVLPGVTLTSVTNYQHQAFQWLLDSDYQSRITQLFVGSRETWRAFSEEFRAQTNYDGPLNAMVGVLYQDTRLFADQNVYSGNQRTSTAPLKFQYVAFAKNSSTDGETISPFGQVTWKPIDQIELGAGVRYTHETKDSVFFHPFVRAGQIYVQYDPTKPNTIVLTKQKFTNWSPEATIAYKPTENINIYAGYKTGYKSGGFSNESNLTVNSVAADLDFEPEKAKGFEGGIKTTLLNRQLRFDVALFNYKYTNLQVDFFEAQTFRFVTTNAGSARTKGVEINAEFAPRAVPGLSVRGAINYVKARYLDFIAPCFTGETPAQGCNPTTASPFGGLLVQDLSGRPTANAPRWTGALGGSYESSIGGSLTAGFSTDARYSSRYNGSPFNNPLAVQRKYVNLDASFFLRSEAGWQLAVISKNLTNQFVIGGSLDGPGTGSGTGTAAGRLADQRGYANDPRTVQLQVTYRY